MIIRAKYVNLLGSSVFRKDHSMSVVSAALLPWKMKTCVLHLEELTPRPDTPPDRTALRSIPDLDDLSLGLGTKTSRSGINLRVVRSGGVSGLGVSSSTRLRAERPFIKALSEHSVEPFF